MRKRLEVMAVTGSAQIAEVFLSAVNLGDARSARLNAVAMGTAHAVSEAMRGSSESTLAKLRVICWIFGIERLLRGKGTEK